MMTSSDDTQQPTFEESLSRLEAIVRRLEEGQIGLAESLKEYEEGVKLLRYCHGLLEGAERRIELLSGVDAAGNPIAKPFEDSGRGSLEEKSKSRGRRRSSAQRIEPEPDDAGEPE